MLTRISKFLSLSRREKQLFLHAFILLGLMRVAILTISFKRLTRSLTLLPATFKPQHLTVEQLHIAKRIGQMVTQAANNTPWDSACLVQALTAQRMLKKRNIPGVFYLGIPQDKGGNGKLEAHAWSQCGELIVTGDRGREAFTVLSVFGWGKH